VTGALRDRQRAQRMGTAAQARVREELLGVRHLTASVELFERVIRDAEAHRPVAAVP